MKTFQEYASTVNEEKDQQTVTLTTSCLIRLLEYVREDVNDDTTLHKIVESMTSCKDVIDIECYNIIIKGIE